MPGVEGIVLITRQKTDAAFFGPRYTFSENIADAPSFPVFSSKLSQALVHVTLRIHGNMHMTAVAGKGNGTGTV
jgi:hypothetical protein